MFNEEKIAFRIAEKITYGNTRFFIPQIQEDDQWYDIDFDGDEYSSVSEGNGDLKFDNIEEAQKAIEDYCKEKEEELKETIKETIYHEVKI